MKKNLFIITYFLIIAIIPALMPACNEKMDEKVSNGKTPLFYISNRIGKELTMPIDYYIFQENILYKMGSAPVSPFLLPAMENSRIFFFAGEKKPAELSSVEIGKTTLSDFENIRTDLATPIEFYTGSLLQTENTVYNVPLTIGEAQIDLDATSSNLLKIHKVRIDNAPASTLVFPRESPAISESTTEKICELTPPVERKKENIFRIYESGVPVNFNVEGEYDGIPISFAASLPQVVRNTKYTLKVMNAGAEMTGVFSIEEWVQTDTVNTGLHADEKLLIATEYSKFPEGTEVADSKQSLSVPHRGGEVILAFLAESEVDFESVIDDLSNLEITPLDVRRERDKILTRFKIQVKGQGENTLPYMTRLNVKSILRQHSTSMISLTVECPPLYIREVTLGGMTWMAFNARSRDVNDQIYPMKGYDVEEMYHHEWLTTLGGMFQYGRNYRYDPWKSGVNNEGNQTEELSWSEAANTPCPEGYRLPTSTELIDLFGGGIVPGTWTSSNGESITASEITATNSQIDINGVRGVAKILKLTDSRGECMYIPYGGMKSNVNPSPADPRFEQGFRLWCSDITEEGQAMSLFYGNIASVETHIKSFKRIGVDKEAYGYVRCIKIEK